MQLPPLAPQEPNAALPLGAAAQGAPASSPVRTGSPPAGAQLLPQATTPPNRPELLSPLKAMAGGSGLSPNKTGGVFWGKSPNARQAQREMSSKIKATAGWFFLCSTAPSFSSADTALLKAGVLESCNLLP